MGTVVAASNLGGWPAVGTGIAALIAVGVILVGALQDRQRTSSARRAQHERERAYAEAHPPVTPTT